MKELTVVFRFFTVKKRKGRLCVFSFLMQISYLPVVSESKSCFCVLANVKRRLVEGYYIEIC